MLHAVLILTFAVSLAFAEETKPLAQEARPPAAGAPADKTLWEKVKDTSSGAYDYSKKKADEAHTALSATADNRAETTWTIHGNYSLFETWIISKYGLTVGWNKSRHTTFELEYMRGSLGFEYFGFDFAKIEEQRIALLWRTYGNRTTLSFVQGFYYNRLEAHLGDEMLKTFSSDERAHYELMQLDTIGITWGIGNRWQLKNGFVMGADWFSINLPLIVASQKTAFIEATPHENDRENIRKTWNVLKHFPEVAVVKMQFGWSF